MNSSIKTISIISGVIVICVATWFYTKPKIEGGDERAAGRSGKAIPVRVVDVATQAVPYVLDVVGTVEAEQSIAIRAEVSGVLNKISFREGDQVKAGQLLFQIDADLQQAEVDKALANLARDQAALTEAGAQARRLQSLVAKEYVTQQEYAQAVAQEKAAEAAVRAAQAALQSVRLQYGHAHIRSPISGRAGIVSLKQGNLVSAGSATPLVVINAMQVVMVSFSVPQQQLQAIREGQRKKPLTVEVRHDANGALLARGALAFIDNSIDPQTGTLRMKARIPNKDEVIWPGELVNLRLVLGVQQDALVVPETAVMASQNGAFVYVMAEGKAQMRPVIIARQVESQVVVTEGLSAGEKVIIKPPKNLRPDSAVELMGAGKAPNNAGKSNQTADIAKGTTPP